MSGFDKNSMPNNIYRLWEAINDRGTDRLQKLLDEGISLKPEHFHGRSYRMDAPIEGSGISYHSACANPLCFIDAPCYHHLEKMRMMLEHGADPNAPTNVYMDWEYGMLSLHYRLLPPIRLYREEFGEDGKVEIFNKQELDEVIKLLVEYGADNGKWSAPKKVLQAHYEEAVRDGRKETAENLLKIINKRTKAVQKEGGEGRHITYYEDGEQVCCRYGISDIGNYDGPFELYSKDRTLIAKCKYNDGVLDGPYIGYGLPPYKGCWDERPFIKCNFKNGVFVGDYEEYFPRIRYTYCGGWNNSSHDVYGNPMLLRKKCSYNKEGQLDGPYEEYEYCADPSKSENDPNRDTDTTKLKTRTWFLNGKEVTQEVYEYARPETVKKAPEHFATRLWHKVATRTTSVIQKIKDLREKVRQ